jgi:hypothetical protein
MELVIYDLLNSVIHNIADSNEKEQSSMLEWMRFSIDVMRTMNGSNEHVKENYQVIFPAEMLLKYLKKEYNMDSKINVNENPKSILKKDDSQYPAKTVTFTDTVSYQEPPTYENPPDHEKPHTDETGTRTHDGATPEEEPDDTPKDKDNEDGSTPKEELPNDTMIDKEDGDIDNENVTENEKGKKMGDVTEEDASFGNITFMDDRGEYFANFFSDI